MCKYPGARVSDAHGEHTCLLTQHLYSEGGGPGGQKVVRLQRTGAAWVSTLGSPPHPSVSPDGDVAESTRASPRQTAAQDLPGMEETHSLGTGTQRGQLKD